MTEINKPKDREIFNVNGESREVFMSGGLLRQLVPFIGNLTDLGQAYSDTVLQQVLIVETLKTRSKRGNPINENDVETINDFSMSTEEMERLFNWIMDHILSFFIKSVTSAKTLVDTHQEVLNDLMKLMPSENGSKPSAEQNQ